MKRPLLIAAGITLVLLMLGVWLYLFLFGAPGGGGEIADNLGFDLNSRPAEVIEDNLITEPEYSVDTTTSRLSQLTTKPVAGFVGFAAASSSVIRYVEQGTGHIYEVDFEGDETMISRTTIPRVQEAYFSPDGQTVVLVTINGYNRDVMASSIDTGTKVLSVTNLPTNAMNITVTDSSSIRYTLQTAEGSIGYRSNLAGNITELFRVPFRSISVLWGEDNTWIYNRPAEGLVGYLYEIVGGTYVATPHSGYEMVVSDFETYLAVTELTNDQFGARFIANESGERFEAPVLVLPEKCDAFHGTDGIVCAAPLTMNVNLADWYKGLTLHEDSLWLINDVQTSEALLLENLAQTAGRALDVIDLQIAESDNFMLFRNKTDGTLWLYLI